MNAMLSRGLAGLLLVAAVTATARADDPKVPPAHKDLDQRISSSLRDTIAIGIKMFNDEDDAAGCYQLYRGALIATIPHLEHRPQLKKACQEKLAKSEMIPSIPERAFALRGVMDDIRTAIRGDAPAGEPLRRWQRKNRCGSVWAESRR